MKRYWSVEFGVLAGLFIGMLVLMAMVLDARAEIRQLRREAAPAVRAFWGDDQGLSSLERRVECLEERERTVESSPWRPAC